MRRKSPEKQELEADTIGYMPERFITAYFELVRIGLQIDPRTQKFDNESARAKKAYTEHGGGLKDERALRFKAWVDRQLRAIGRDIQAYLNARGGAGPSPIGLTQEMRREIAKELEKKTELKCRGCGKYVSWQWTCCAWCGRKIVEDGRRIAGGEISGQVGSHESDNKPTGSSSEQETPAYRLEQSPGTTGQDIT